MNQPPGEISGLGAVDRLAGGLAKASWFAALGQAPAESERQDGLAYLSALGYGKAGLEWAPDWAAAEKACKDSAWTHQWWDKEEALRKQLFETASEVASEQTVSWAIDRLMKAASDLVMGAAARAAARDGIADEVIIRVAAGSATQVIYQAGVALAADAGPTHPFLLKYRIFAAGRWPLGLIGDKFHIF